MWRTKPSFNLIAAALLLVPIVIAPWFNSPYEAPKWILIYLLTAFLLIQRKTLAAPLIAFLIFPGMVFAVHFVSRIPVQWINVGLPWFCWWVLFFTDFDIRKAAQPVLIALVVVVGIGLLQAKGINLISFVPAGDYPDSTFGYQNITAEFVGSALLLILVLKPKNFAVVAVFAFAYLTLLSCRAVFAGIAAGLVFCGVGFTKKGMIFAALLIGLLIFYRENLVPKTKPEFWQNKAHNTELRLLRWGDTWELIRKNPLGIGLGNHAQYRGPSTGEMIDNPHNHYLQIVAEAGWIPGLACILAALSLLAMGLVKREGQALFLSQGFYLVVTSLFAFPLQQPFIFLISALALGHAAKNIPLGSRNLTGRPFRLFGDVLRSG